MRNLSLKRETGQAFRTGLLDRFGKAIDKLKGIIIDNYHMELIDVVPEGSKSKADPALYLNEFIRRLDAFEYIEEIDGLISLVVPDEGTFDFSGELRLLEMVLNGVSGRYVEMTEADYVLVFGNPPITEEVLDENVPVNERVYIIGYSEKVRRAEKYLEREFTIYPFSNTPPIDLFTNADEFVEKNIDRWIEEALMESNKAIVSQLRGDSI